MYCTAQEERLYYNLDDFYVPTHYHEGDLVSLPWHSPYQLWIYFLCKSIKVNMTKTIAWFYHRGCTLVSCTHGLYQNIPVPKEAKPEDGRWRFAVIILPNFDSIPSLDMSQTLANRMQRRQRRNTISIVINLIAWFIDWMTDFIGIVFLKNTDYNLHLHITMGVPAWVAPIFYLVGAGVFSDSGIKGKKPNES